MLKKAINLKEGIKQVRNLTNKLIKEKPVIIIGVVGGSGSGKEYVSKIISKKLKAKILSMDNYYIGVKKIKDKNFDSPNAIDLNLLKKNIILLKQKKKIKKPIYDFVTNIRVGYEKYNPSKIIIVEGLFTLNKILRKKIDIGIFVDASESIKLKRRLKRDIVERGRTKESIIKYWNKTVKPMYNKYVKPWKKYADIIIINE